MQPQPLFSFVKKYFSVGLAIWFLMVSWSTCYFFFLGLTEGWGAPWDIAPIRPPLGHWQRTINDFFESGIGRFLPAMLFLILSFALYLRTAIRTRNVKTTSFVFGLTNLLTLAVSLIITLLIQAYLIHIPAELTPDDWSYWGDFRREWPLSLIMAAIFTALLFLQPRFVDRYDKE